MHVVVHFVQLMNTNLEINAESENVHITEFLQVKLVKSTNQIMINICINTANSIYQGSNVNYEEEMKI
jgi:hypothetical protein